MGESVDTSFTKPQWDDTVLNMVKPPLDMLYVGWTEPGEWLRYTVEVGQTAEYTVSFFYSSPREHAAVALCWDDAALCTLEPEQTGHPHLWNYARLARVTLEKGVHVLTLCTARIGLMNYGYLFFELTTKGEEKV